MTPRARPYQVEAIASTINRFDAGDQRTLLVLPTGGGKTIVAGFVAKHFLDASPGRVMVLAHRDELIRQAVDKFHRVTGIRAAVEKGQEWSNEEDVMYEKSRLVVSSFQTQYSGNGTKRMHRFDPKDFSFLWVDEAHHALADTYKAVIDYYASGNPDLKVLGVTATADRGDGEGIGKVFQSCAYRYELPQIISDGYLVGIRQMRVVIEGLNLSKCRTTAGDLNASDLEYQFMLEKPLHGVAHATIEAACGLENGYLKTILDRSDRNEILKAVLADKPRRRTLVFTPGVAMAQLLAEIFNRWIPDSALHVDGTMPLDGRRQTLSRFAAGEIQFLCNCMVCTEGYDEPGIELVVCARPTKSRALYCQMIGRGTRPLDAVAQVLGDIETADARRAAIAASAKPNMTVLDFVGNSGKHKLITAADILGGEKYDASVVERAAEIAAERGDEGVDVDEALEEAQEEADRSAAVILAEEDDAQDELDAQADDELIAESARRLGIVATADYHAQEVDPFDTDRTYAPYEPPIRQGGATEKQARYIEHLSRGSFPYAKAMNLTKHQASGVIGGLMAKQQGAA